MGSCCWTITITSTAFIADCTMFIKQIFALGMLNSTCFGALTLLRDIGNFKKDLLTFLLPPRPSQDLTHPSTHKPDTAPDYPELDYQSWEPVTNQNGHHQFQEIQDFIKPQPDDSQQATTSKPALSTEADKTLYREDVLNNGKLHDKKQRVDSGYCVGNKFCPGIDIDNLE